MENSDLLTVLLATITAFSGVGAWNFYQKKLELKAKQREEETEQGYLYRDDLRDRVAVLEARLEENRKERDELIEKITELSAETSALRVEVQYLREERQKLQEVINTLSITSE